MQIQVNTDRNIEGREKLAVHVTSVVEHALSRFSDRVTRVEVHLSDQNGGKSGKDDKRCVIEVRLNGRKPTAVTCDAATLHQAIDGAAERIQRSIDSDLGRVHEKG